MTQAIIFALLNAALAAINVCVAAIVDHPIRYVNIGVAAFCAFVAVFHIAQAVTYA